MRMESEVAVAPANDQTQSEEHDERRYGRLRTLLDALGQEPLREQSRDPSQVATALTSSHWMAGSRAVRSLR